ncbi:hypothetical protein ACTXT7_011663 [Hymenolepis weldensis]
MNLQYTVFPKSKSCSYREIKTCLPYESITSIHLQDAIIFKCNIRRCTYRVAPIKSKNDIRDGDLIIETSDHKYLKVLGPNDCSQGDDFYVFIECGKKSRRHRTKFYSSSSSSSSSTEEEAHYSRKFIPTSYVNAGNRCNCPG